MKKEWTEAEVEAAKLRIREAPVKWKLMYERTHIGPSGCGKTETWKYQAYKKVEE